MNAAEVGDRILCVKCGYSEIISLTWIKEVVGRDHMRVLPEILDYIECPECGVAALDFTSGVIKHKSVLPHATWPCRQCNRAVASGHKCPECGGSESSAAAACEATVEAK